jgi:hypothetical protein
MILRHPSVALEVAYSVVVYEFSPPSQEISSLPFQFSTVYAPIEHPSCPSEANGRLREKVRNGEPTVVSRKHPLTAPIGVTGDTITKLLKYTALNPALTLPLILLARYTSQGGQLASEYGTVFKTIRTLATLGVLNTVSNYLSEKVINNWSSDEWDWSKEVVVVTGGSDGIGKVVVGLLAERGVKVAVLDVQQLTYEGKLPAVYPQGLCAEGSENDR